MRPAVRLAAAAAAVAGLLAAVQAPGAPGPAPDLILAHGTILTLDARDSTAQALAVRDGKILAVGSDRDILRLARGATRIVDLHGRTATPGLIDTHAHIADGGVEELYHISLSDASSVAEIVRRVRLGVGALHPGEWLVGDGWDEGKLAERRYVLAADLDQVAPDNPVWLMHTTGHYGAANSLALRLAHIGAGTANPPAGTIDRDPAGAPTGVLKEAAMDALVNLIPPPTGEQWRAGILHSIDTLHSEGITAVKDPWIRAPTWEAYRQLAADGLLDEDVCVLWDAGRTVAETQAAIALIRAEPRSLGDGRLLSCGAKLFMDGSGGARTAWVYKEWNKNSTEIDAGNFGYPNIDPADYLQQVTLLHRAGIQVGTHAVGDRAIDTVVDTYAAVLAAAPQRGLRHTIIHANIPTEHAIDTMAMLQKRFDAGYPEAQAPFMWWIGDTYAANFGPERGQRLMPLKTYVSKGVRWGGGSDYSVTPLAARYGLWSSVVRETLKGSYGAHPFGTAQAVDVHQALRSYTTWAAPLLFLDKRTGSLQAGKDADIAVWDRNPYAIPAAELRDLHCEMTYFRGKRVYQAQAR